MVIITESAENILPCPAASFRVVTSAEAAKLTRQGDCINLLQNEKQAAILRTLLVVAGGCLPEKAAKSVRVVEGDQCLFPAISGGNFILATF